MRASRRLRVKAAFAAASLIPGAALAGPATGVANQPDAPLPRPSGVTRTVEMPGTGNLRIDLHNLINAGRETIDFPNGARAEFQLSNLEKDALPADQRAAYEMMYALAQEKSPEAWTALKKILTSAGADGLLLARKATIDRPAAKKVAVYLEHVGLTPIDRTAGLSIARDLEQGQLAYALELPKGRNEDRVVELLSKTSRPELDQLRELLGAEINNPKLRARAEFLGARVIDAELVNKVIARAAERGIALDAPRLLERLQSVGPRPDGEGARADWYRRVVESQGLTWRDGVDEMNVVGLRGFDVDGGRNPNVFNQWNDTLAFVWRGEGGGWNVREFEATTDPGETSWWDSPDVDHNGSGDVAHLTPGQYPYRIGTHHDVYGAGNPEINVPVDRDTNHDGQIGPVETRESRERGDVGYGINIHWGPGYDATPVGMYSLGCQVTVMNSGEFHANVTPLLAANRGQMLYALVDMNTVA